jgi:ribosome modulation factor
MEFLEHPLLNTPSLTLSLLKVATERDWATLEDGVAHLKGALVQAHEPLAVAVPEIVSHLRETRRHLVAAGLLAVADDGRFTITERGRQVLAEHPMGVDDSVLTQFPEFREFIRRSSPHRVPENPELGAQEEGYWAYLDGQSAVDNPYEFDTGKHLAWENGWFEARDEQIDHPRGPLHQATEES